MVPQVGRGVGDVRGVEISLGWGWALWGWVQTIRG